MEGYEVTNDKGETAWWDGKRIIPIQKNDSSQKLIAEAGATAKSAAGDLNRANQAPEESSLLSSPSEVDTKADAYIPAIRAMPPKFPRTEKVMKAVVGPAATLAAGFVPGALPLQMAVGAGTEALGEKLGGKDLDPAAIAGAAAVPAGARALMGGLKMAGRTVGKLVGKSGIVEAGVEKLNTLLGADKASAKALFKEGVASEIPVAMTGMGNTARAITQNITDYKRLGGAEELITEAEDLARNSMKAATEGQPWNYGEWFEKAKMLNESAQKNITNTEAAGMREIRGSILDDLAKISPIAEEAVTAYRRQSGIGDLAKALTKTNPLKEVNLLLNDKLAGSVLSASEKSTAKIIAGHVGPEGLGKTLLALGALGAAGYSLGGVQGAAVAGIPHILGALITNPKGGFIARSLIGPSGNVNKAVLPALASLVRGYMSQPNDTAGPNISSAKTGSQLGGAGGF